MKSKLRLVSKQSASVAALKQKLAAIKAHADEMKVVAHEAKAGFKQARKSYKQAKKAAKQARKAVKALLQEIKAQTPKKIRRPSGVRPVGANKLMKKVRPKAIGAPGQNAQVNLGVMDGPAESAVAVVPNPSPTSPA